MSWYNPPLVTKQGGPSLFSTASPQQNPHYLPPRPSQGLGGAIGSPSPGPQWSRGGGSYKPLPPLCAWITSCKMGHRPPWAPWALFLLHSALYCALCTVQ